jgi:nucleotidyltransferase AbiEii toxin of type IV toxin-antitoxin system
VTAGRASRRAPEFAWAGVRLRGAATLSGARIAVVVDIGFGDSVEPGLETIDYPALLGLPAPRLRAYAPETVIAEKFQAMVALGRANSRMKDFYDIWILTKTFDFVPDRLARAIAATFARRQTVIPADQPDALTPDFAEDPQKQRQWAAFIADIDHAPRQLALVVGDLAPFLMDAAAAAHRQALP